MSNLRTLSRMLFFDPGTGHAAETEQEAVTGVPEVTAAKATPLKDYAGRSVPPSRWKQLVVVVLLSVALASFASHLIAVWLGIPRLAGGSLGVYRRVGPETGDQVFSAGSSLLLSALSWSKVSKALGQGIETWAVGGSSPDIWETWQQNERHYNMTIIGVSVYDLNEMHLADGRAAVVPLSRTITDLWTSHSDPALSDRILNQYVLRYVRILFPTAGHTNHVLIGLRSKAGKMIGRRASFSQPEGVVYQPAPPVLDAGEDTTSITDWSSARRMRRVAALRSENHGRSEFFNGPKHMAFRRLLFQARRRGRVIVLVLPVSSWYNEAFLNGRDRAAFEAAIQQAMTIAPDATVVRLDELPGISDPAYFADLVHMNSQGRRVATQAFLKQLAEEGPRRVAGATPTTSETSR